jgi:toxin ParE1/3/4
MEFSDLRELVYSDAAIGDLEEIFAWSIQEWGDDHFIRFRQELISSIRSLVHQPKLGQERSDLALGLRILRVAPHSVIYLVNEDRVEIVRVIHQRRDLRRIDWQ